MSERELRVSEREVHPMHAVGLTIEDGKRSEEGQNFWALFRRQHTNCWGNTLAVYLS